MKYEQVQNLPDESFRRLTGVKRQTFEKMVKILAERVRFYRMPKRSATDCAWILDVCQKLQLLDEQKYIKGRELIVRIVSILVKMAQRKN